MELAESSFLALDRIPQQNLKFYNLLQENVIQVKGSIVTTYKIWQSEFEMTTHSCTFSKTIWTISIKQKKNKKKK